MGRIVAMMSVSVDGYIEGPGRELDWHRVDEELHRHFNGEIAAMAGLLNGRVTYELMAGFWPQADTNPDSTPTMIAFAGIWREIPKIVFSRTLRDADWNTTVWPEVDPERLRRFAAGSAGDLGLGGAELIAECRRQELIDEYRIYVHPVLVGRGKPLFTSLPATSPLILIGSRVFGNGVVLLHYRRVDPQVL